MKKRFKIYDLRFTIFLLLFILFINHKSLFINPVYAADSTPSSEIRSKLEELKKEIASKAAKLKLEVNRKLQNKAYVGNLKTKSETSLTLASDKGPKIITINQDTIFESKVKTKQKFSSKTLTEEDYIACLGDVDDNGVLTAKKVILLPSQEEKEKLFLWGQVISASDALITIKNRESKNMAVSAPSQAERIRTNDFVILVGHMGKNDIFISRFLYVIPQGGIIKSKSKMATPSAKISTPSASPKTLKR